MNIYIVYLVDHDDCARITDMVGFDDRDKAVETERMLMAQFGRKNVYSTLITINELPAFWGPGKTPRKTIGNIVQSSFVE